MKNSSITVDVKVGIPDETICRCLRVLEMWMDDHPDDKIIIDREETETGFRHRAYIKWHSREQENYNDEKPNGNMENDRRI